MRKNTLKHIIFCFVDHYEPFTNKADFKRAKLRVEKCLNGYPLLAGKFKDSDNKYPQHTWFYPPHHDHIFLGDLVKLCKMGYGEIEMHLHHNHMAPFPENETSFKEKVTRCVNDFSQYGVFCAGSEKKFAFIHGDWSLDNSRGVEFCGVNNELSILQECGCYADFTFPALNRAQPLLINKIYYAKDNCLAPKSYNWGREVKMGGGRDISGLLIIQGILGLRWDRKKKKICIEASNVDNIDIPSPERLDYWIRHGIRIKGNEEWIFIKVHTHGANEETWQAWLGEDAEFMFEHLKKHYDDGLNYCLHYVSAREMFNIVKAAEAGFSGNPNDFRNFLIPKYNYLP